MTNNFFVYLLISSNKTYVGATVNIDRRLRQHNKELVGGAKYTKIEVDKGGIWKLACYISEFPNWNSALQFEWQWKYINKKISKKYTSLERRIHSLRLLLSNDKSTIKSIPFSQWDIPPKININLDIVNDIIKKIEN